MSLPSAQEAYQHLTNRVDQEVYFRTLANFDTVPVNVKEAEDLYRLGFELQAAEEQAAVKQASASGLSGIVADIEAHLGGQGLHRAKEAQAAEDAGMREMAAYLAKDPTVYNSVLSLKAAEAEAWTQQNLPAGVAG